MKITELEIKGVFCIEPRVFEDNRGHFFESFNHEKFQDLIQQNIEFVQDNESLSSKDVIRGLHFQVPPHPQGKLVRVIRGAVLDVAVDLRKNSSTYGHHVKLELSESNKRQLWIPSGFAHGFLAKEKDTIFAYKCTDYYAPLCEQALLWNDPTLNINWGVETPLVSVKDQEALLFQHFKTPFL